MSLSDCRLVLRADLPRPTHTEPVRRRVAYLSRRRVHEGLEFASAAVAGDDTLRGAHFGPLDDLLLWSATPALHSIEVNEAIRRFAPLPRQTVVAVVLGTGPHAGRWAAKGVRAGHPLGVEQVRLLGPELLLLTRDTPVVEAVSPEWSRLVGAIGERAFRTLRGLRVAVVGLGRTGTLAVDLLARHGVRSLTLVDGDVDERHHIDSTLAPAEVGRAKVLNRADWLAGRFGDAMTVRAVPRGVRVPAATAALHAADVVVTCVDDDAARLLVSDLANRLALVHLDIGTGVFRDPRGIRRGADIRFCVPGEACLSCLGGFRDESAAREALARPLGLMTTERPPEWYDRRAGSLPGLNAVAAGVGVQLLVDLAVGTRHGSGWVRVDWPPGGVPAVTESTPTRRPPCRVCGQWTASGTAWRSEPQI